MSHLTSTLRAPLAHTLFQLLHRSDFPLCTGFLCLGSNDLLLWKNKLLKGKTDEDTSRHLPQKHCMSSGKLVPLEPRGRTALGPEDWNREGLLLLRFTSWVKSRKAAKRSLRNKAQGWRQWQGGGRRMKAVKSMRAPARITHTSAPHIVRWNLNLAQGLVSPCKSLTSSMLFQRGTGISQRENALAIFQAELEAYHTALLINIGPLLITPAILILRSLYSKNTQIPLGYILSGALLSKTESPNLWSHMGSLTDPNTWHGWTLPFI